MSSVFLSENPQSQAANPFVLLFTGWIYDHLLPHAEKVKVARRTAYLFPGLVASSYGQSMSHDVGNILAQMQWTNLGGLVTSGYRSVRKRQKWAMAIVFPLRVVQVSLTRAV
jgi:hypothetical protein